MIAERMETKETSAGVAEAPVEVYRERAARFRRDFERQTERWNRIGNVRLFTFLGAAVAVVWGVWGGITPLWLVGIGLLVGFFVLVWYHNRVGRVRRRDEELYRINNEAVLRVERRWDDLPLRHNVRAQPGDPYAGDLDIFGRASLMHLLETVGTFMGEATLVRWLREPASPETVRERQWAVKELAPEIDLRDELTLRGRLMGDEKPDPAPFLEWSESEPWLDKRKWLPWAALGSVTLFWGLVAAQVFGLVGYPLWFIVGAGNIIFTLGMERHIYERIAKASAGEQGFKHYASAFELLSSAKLESAEMKRLQGALSVDGVPAHGALRQLHRITTFEMPIGSQLYLPIEAVTLWDVHLLRVLERWQKKNGKHARRWLETLGEVEALAAMGGLSHANPDWDFPAVEHRADCLEAKELGHPLLAGDVRVTNDVKVGPPGTFLLVTGSNMSGKSTLLRAMGVNVVLAQAGGPVCAEAMKMPPLSLWTSMRVEDSLARGVSYFMAELQRLKQIVDAARAMRMEGDRRLFYLLDEVLQGTNTSERQIAARKVIMYLVRQGALGAVSTHDLTLADASEIAEVAQLVHFTETIHDGDERSGGGPQMTFDYKLRPGLATSTNALKLMEIVGLDFE
jgi:ABC-type cobalamin/Fe3+-siderophores transport system ATPase subunit